MISPPFNLSRHNFHLKLRRKRYITTTRFQAFFLNNGMTSKSEHLIKKLELLENCQVSFAISSQD